MFSGKPEDFSELAMWVFTPAHSAERAHIHSSICVFVVLMMPF